MTNSGSWLQQVEEGGREEQPREKSEVIVCNNYKQEHKKSRLRRKQL